MSNACRARTVLKFYVFLTLVTYTRMYNFVAIYNITIILQNVGKDSEHLQFTIKL